VKSELWTIGGATEPPGSSATAASRVARAGGGGRAVSGVLRDLCGGRAHRVEDRRHHRRRPVRVGVDHRAGELAVRGNGRRAEPRPVERRGVDVVKAAVDLLDQLSEQRIAGGVVDRRVEREVGGAPVRAGVVGGHQHVEPRHDERARRGGGDGAGDAHRLDLERAAHRKHPRQAVGLDLHRQRQVQRARRHLRHDAGARALVARDDPQAFPAPQRLAHGGPAEAEAPGDGDLRR
jgi:hypothetical protein